MEERGGREMWMLILSVVFVQLMNVFGMIPQDLFNLYLFALLIEQCTSELSALFVSQYMWIYLSMCMKQDFLQPFELLDIYTKLV